VHIRMVRAARHGRDQREARGFRTLA
jgi:hypothetical protein